MKGELKVSINFCTCLTIVDSNLMKGELKALALMALVRSASSESHEGRIERSNGRNKACAMCATESHEGRIESSTTLLDVSYLA